MRLVTNQAHSLWLKNGLFYLAHFIFVRLDGCKMIFVIIEWIRGKPVNRTVEGYIHFIGLLLLFGFVIAVDLLRLFG